MPHPAGEVARRHNVHVSGDPAGRPLVFAPGFGGDQSSWRQIAPAFEADHRVVLFDHAGAGRSDLAAYDRVKHDSLHGYADDVVAILDELAVRDAVFVGHCVSGMIGVLAVNRRPDLIGGLVLIGASPRYLDNHRYFGGFSREAVDDLLASLESNPVRSPETLSPLFGGPAAMQDADTGLAMQLARAMFLSDTRRDLADVVVPSLILQSADDRLVPPDVAEYLHSHLPGSELVHLQARGHQVNLTAPDEVAGRIRDHLDRLVRDAR